MNSGKQRIMVRNFHSSSISSILWLTTVCIVKIQALWVQFEFIGIENSKTGIVQSDFRITRIDRTSISISGTFKFTEDFKDHYDAEIKLFYSSKGNNQYVKLPFKIARAPCCELLENVYWTTVQKELERVSDVPKRIGTEKLCFLYKKGNYTLRGFVFDQKVLPKFAEPGTYKAEFSILKKYSDDVDSTYTFIARLY